MKIKIVDLKKGMLLGDVEKENSDPIFHIEVLDVSHVPPFVEVEVRNVISGEVDIWKISDQKIVNCVANSDREFR